MNRLGMNRLGMNRLGTWRPSTSTTGFRLLATTAACLVLATPAIAGKLKPLRVSAYFSWVLKAGHHADGDVRNGVAEEFPELVQLGKSTAFVRVATENGRSSLRILPDLAALLAEPKRRAFPERQVPAVSDKSDPGGFGFGGVATREPAVIGALGDGVYRFRGSIGPDETCQAGQVFLSSDGEPTALTCRDMSDVIRLSGGIEPAFVLIDGTTVRFATHRAGRTDEGPATTLVDWLGGPQRRVTATASAITPERSTIAVGVDGLDAGPMVCAQVVTELDRSRAPAGLDCNDPLWRGQRGEIVSALAWRADGAELAIVVTARATGLSRLVHLDVTRKEAVELTRAVEMPKVLSVPYVPPSPIRWIDDRLYWLTRSGGKGLVAQFAGGQVQTFSLPDQDVCEADAPLVFEDVDIALDTSPGAATERRTSLARIEAALGRVATEDELDDAKFFEEAPAWIPLTCGSRQVARPVTTFIDLGWFAPARLGGVRRDVIVAGVVVKTAAVGITNPLFTSGGTSRPLPTVVRIAVFELEQ